MATRARQKTLAHLQKLAATAAVVGSAACNHGCGGSGYAVVDPMPTPVRNFARFVTATVAWAEGGARIVLEVKDPTGPGMVFSAKASQADGGLGIGSANGGRIVSEAKTADGMRFELEPDPGRGAMYVDMNVDGPDGLGTVEARIDWGSVAEPPKAGRAGSDADGGRALTVTMDDR